MAPLSPHLQIYKPFLTMVFSISSRIGMIAFAFSLPFFAIWLGSANTLPQFIIWFFIFNHHLLNGLKYYFWSYALGLDIKNVYLVTYTILGANIIMTLFFAWIIF